jgi:hypothetical protein
MPGDFCRFRVTLILQFDTVWDFSGKFVMIQEDAEKLKVESGQRKLGRGNQGVHSSAPPSRKIVEE